MTPLEKLNSMPMPFAQLKGVTFTEADKDRVVARMLVRPDLCTLGHMLHGGAIMALADSVGAAATVINLPADAMGTTTIESKTNFIGGASEGMTVVATATPVHRGRRTQVLANAARDRGGQTGRRGDADPNGPRVMTMAGLPALRRPGSGAI
jgi:1,4-dihydroxy-2-naphthoyl-CoA hydrolase